MEAEYFEFFVPDNVKTIDVVGIDSLVGRFEGPNYILTYDYGWYSDPLNGSGYDEYTSHIEEIGGKEAKIASFYFPDTGYKFDYAIGVHFSATNSSRARLTMLAVCESPAEYEKMKAIFRTIRFF